MSVVRELHAAHAIAGDGVQRTSLWLRACRKLPAFNPLVTPLSKWFPSSMILQHADAGAEPGCVHVLLIHTYKHAPVHRRRVGLCMELREPVQVVQSKCFICLGEALFRPAQRYRFLHSAHGVDQM